MKSIPELKAQLDLDALDGIRREFATSKEKEVQHYLSWGEGGEGYFEVDRCLATALAHYAVVSSQWSVGQSARILDLGTGFGWFPFVARQHGHTVLGADVAHGHTGGKRKSPDCADMFRQVNACLGNNAVAELAPIKAHRPIEFNSEPGTRNPELGTQQWSVVTALGTLYDRDWSIADYEFFWRDLEDRYLVPGGKIYAQSNVSKWGNIQHSTFNAQHSILLVSAANATYRPIVAKWLRHAEALGYPAIVYDLGGLGLGQNWLVKDEPFQRDGRYWRHESGWPTKGLHKPAVIADALQRLSQPRNTPNTRNAEDVSSVSSVSSVVNPVLVYCDADALPIAKLDALAQVEFDVAVTERNEKETLAKGTQKYPGFYGEINAGVIAFRANERSAAFVQEWSERTLKERNDQKALNGMLKDKQEETERTEKNKTRNSVLSVSSCSLLRLPAEWNWPYACSKIKGQQSNYVVPPTTKILHFKSRRWEPFAQSPSAPAIMLPEFDRQELVRRLPPRTIGAEIGVLTGRFSEQLLRGTNPHRLHLIDVWRALSDNADKSGEHGPVDHERNYQMTKVRLAPWTRRGVAQIHRGLTREEIPKLPDLYLDWAYLDANHAYAAVLDDLQLLAPKMKEGGIIAGHDYVAGNEWARQVECGVVQAVTEFCARTGWKLRYVFADQKRNASFWLER